MRLHDAARRFHQTLAYDGYTGKSLFFVGFSSFDDHSSDGATARRRVLNLVPGQKIPARQVLLIDAQRWLVGAGSPDDFAGTTIREHYGMKKTTDLFTLFAPGEACLAAPDTGVKAYVQKQYFRDVANPLTDSKNDTFWNVFIAPDEPVLPGTFMASAELVFRVRNTYLPVEGLRIAQCDTLDAGAFQTLTFVANGSYDAATDSFATVSTSVPSYAVAYAKLYRLSTQADAGAAAGDLSVLVPTAAITPVVGARFLLASRPWQVLSVQAELDAWLLHARRD